ncbi:MAG: hypothetical protein HOO06_00970 [Bdellovibrionaceae bacterium]|jgi:UDP-2,3-diacylglucosamine pyrophosphatase LpxH|nr:hypothetical protein [Pseudobdellovibrionaceae bacterium]
MTTKIAADSADICTAVISDLHICEAQIPDPKSPLWKRYKSPEYFFDEDFCKFLKHIEVKAEGKPLELVLNGDIFDFDSVTEMPKSPSYRISFLEAHSGLHPQEPKSLFKIKHILSSHKQITDGLRDFILNGHDVIFIIGNHDLELHWPLVQEEVINTIGVPDDFKDKIRFCEWFYISNKDTLIEHGNQYDPYCLCQDPVNPFILRFNRIEVRVPFGNLTTRYMLNNMGFFNPHVDSNFIMSAKEYVVLFFKYIIRKEPFLMVTWFFWSMVTLFQSFYDRLIPSHKELLTDEDRVEEIARKANATPRMVRELQELFVPPASSYPMIIAKELWLDRALLVLVMFYIIFQLFLFINNVYKISFFWMFIPLVLFLPFFVFYSKSVVSEVMEYKEPREKLMWTEAIITKVGRVIYGHTHIIRHEMLGPVEHLNSGTWSSAFKDVECTQALDQKTYVWLQPCENPNREAKMFQFKDGQEKPILNIKDRRRFKG